MTTRHDKRPLLARIFSLEGAMTAFAVYSLGTGLYYGEIIWIFWGAMIIAGLGLLMLVRRRDWKKHWEEMEAEQLRRARMNPPARPDREE
jgi:uncharacterized membrane protein YagU involved in acid resistance